VTAERQPCRLIGTPMKGPLVIRERNGATGWSSSGYSASTACRRRAAAKGQHRSSAAARYAASAALRREPPDIWRCGERARQVERAGDRNHREAGVAVDPFNRKPGSGGPGGWWIFMEIHVAYPRGEIHCPDAAGWRRDRFPARPTEWPIRLRPDWVCEIVSPKHERHDLVDKPRVLHSAEVPHDWISIQRRGSCSPTAGRTTATQSCSAPQQASGPCGAIRCHRAARRRVVRRRCSATLFGDVVRRQ
jgi:hypothetical protein